VNAQLHETGMKKILIIRAHGMEGATRLELFGQQIQLSVAACGDNMKNALEIITQHDGTVDAIGIEALPTWLTPPPSDEAKSTEPLPPPLTTPVFDGRHVRPIIEALSVHALVNEQPRLLSGKKVLMCPGLNHSTLSKRLGQHAASVQLVDPLILLNLPSPLLTAFNTLLQRCSLELVNRLSGKVTANPFTSGRIKRRLQQLDGLCQRFDILAGDIDFILHLSDKSLEDKTVIVESCTEGELELLNARGVGTVIRMIPTSLVKDGQVAVSAAMLEAMLGAVADEKKRLMGKDFCLDKLSQLTWRPEIMPLWKKRNAIHQFAFVIHPLSLAYLHSHPFFKWTRLLPDAVTQTLASYTPSLYLSTIRGAQSTLSGQKVEGYLYALPMTPSKLKSASKERVYRRLQRIAKRAERKGARIFGLGAYTSVVGDAGITLAERSPIAVTSGNSLTVAVTIEASRKALQIGGTDLGACKAMVVGATGSIGAACSWLLAETVQSLVLVSLDPVRLMQLREKIVQRHPQLCVSIATSTDGDIAESDLIIAATSAAGQRIIDIAQCKPGAVICDVSIPPDISHEEAEVRPDVLVISGGQVHLPGVVDVGYDIGLPAHAVYACLAETALLAMEGRFEDYTLGRELDVEKVKAIYALFVRHGGSIAGLRSFGKPVSEEEIRKKRDIALGLLCIDLYRHKAVAQAHKDLARLPVKASRPTLLNPLLRLCYRLLLKRIISRENEPS